MTLNTPPSSAGLFGIDPAVTPLETIATLVSQELEEAAADITHPWATVSMATVTPHGPRQRIVILRGMNRSPLQMFAHTDRRSPKFTQIRNQPGFSLLCYAPGRRVQLVANGTAKVHMDGELLEKHWAATPAERHRNYVGVKAPSTPSRTPSTNLPEFADSANHSEELAQLSLKQFAVIEFNIEFYEVLWLRRSGNLRAGFWKLGDQWQNSWLEP
ncbi:hypothetical protein [Planctomicrobium sp. SH527]|uniref:hypothetical protein n=1 Tax=Planctomicrobium sp. SH527 TaxID=3448123 RepID=UPI003F5B5CA2